MKRGKGTLKGRNWSRGFPPKSTHNLVRLFSASSSFSPSGAIHSPVHSFDPLGSTRPPFPRLPINEWNEWINLPVYSPKSSFPILLSKATSNTPKYAHIYICIPPTIPTTNLPIGSAHFWRSICHFTNSPPLPLSSILDHLLPNNKKLDVSITSITLPIF